MEGRGGARRAVADWWRARSRAELAGVALAVVAIGIAFVAGTWGIFGPIPEGHYASDGAIGMAAENMWRLHTKLPVVGYQVQAPVPANYYMHHPMGVFWVVALLGKVFGFRDFVLRLPAVAYVTLTPVFLYLTARELWGRLAAGLTALAFVSLPITLGFANYHDLEQPVMFGCAIATWGYVRFARTWRERYAIASVLGFAFALNNDWQAYLWGGFMLAALFVRGYLFPEGWFGALRMRPFGRYLGLLCAAILASMALEIAVLDESGRIADLLGSFFVRSGGSGLPWKAVLASRQYRIGLMFSGLAIFLGKLALPVIVARAVLLRQDLELVALPFLGAAAVQYLGFKQGADVHIFWPHMFANYFALAMGGLAAAVADAAAFIGRRLPQPRADRIVAAAPFIALALVGLPLCLVLKDGLSLFRLARESGGRFAEANLESDLDKDAVLKWFLPRVPPTTPVGFHGSIHDYWDKQWQLRPRTTVGNQSVVSPGAPRVFVMDARTSSLADLRAAAAHLHVHAVGATFIADRNEPAAPIDGYALDERNPSFFEAWAYGSTEPIRTVRRDPWLTWEWRLLYGQTAPLPTGTPVTNDQLRIAHNMAKTRGDAGAAAALRASLAARFNLPLAARYDGGTELLGAIIDRGAQRSITLYFVAGTFTADSRFGVHAKVLAPPRFSTLPSDPTDLEIHGAPTYPTTLWRAGHIYTVKFVYRRRPGHERFTGAWVGGPRRLETTSPLIIATF
jgi:hypothetical protein